ncbi:phosphotransferase [Bacillus sp. EAC]|uniref:phosphotransferase n=1 Tax=Bacillus sp. EAC TaxID=1978338 RepID=UPI0015C4FA05|nr:phosphotransferase [Bacillus sp. EAC]
MSNIWDPTVVLDKETAIRILQDQFPELEIKRIEKIGEGFDNTVFKLNNEILLRFPRREVAVSILKIEQKLLPLIKNHIGIKTTVPFIHGKPSELFPWPFLGYNFIYGSPPNRLTKEDRIKMIRPLAEFLKKLHAIPIENLSELDLPSDELKRLDITYRKPLLIKYVNQAIQLKLIPFEKQMNQYIEKLTEIKLSKPFVLVHGDLHFRNMIVDQNNRLEGIIDWGDAHIGQREVDLSIVYSLIPTDSRTAFFEIYGNVSDESKQLAKFKSIYTTILLLLFANDQKESELVKFCQESLLNALQDE